MDKKTQPFKNQTTETPDINICCFDVFKLNADMSDGHSTDIPNVIKLSPHGKFTARDGRALDIDPELLVKRFNSDGDPLCFAIIFKNRKNTRKTNQKRT